MSRTWSAGKPSSGVTSGGASGHRADDSPGDFADAAVAQVGDVEAAAPIQCDVGREEQGRAGCGGAIAGEARVSVGREGADGAVRRHLADPVVERVGDVEVACGIDRHALRPVQLGVDGRRAVAAVSGQAGARHRRDGAIGRDPADHVVARVGDVQVARGVEGQAGRPVELRGRGGAAVARISGHSCSREGADGAVRGDLADPVGVAVGHVDVAGGIHSDSIRKAELRARWPARRRR